MPKARHKTRLSNGQTDFDRFLERRKALPGPRNKNKRIEGLANKADSGITVIKIIAVASPVLGGDAYHGFAGEFMRAVGAYTEAVDVGVLAHLLPAVGTLVGSGPFVFAGDKQSTRVFDVLVGPTNSGRKGTACAPVNLLMEEVDPEFWNSQRVGGLSSGEGLIQKVSDKRTKQEDGTWEVEPAEKRLFVLEPEFSKVLANIRRENNILSQVIREAFDTGNLATLTVEPRQAFGAHISIVAHITPSELTERFDQIEMANGFGNRFLWFYVQSDKLVPFPKPIPSSIFQKFAPRLRGIAGMKPCSVQLGKSAMKLWEQVYPKLREDGPGFVGALTARGAPIVLRLALIYCLLDGKKSIQAEHLKAALAVWKYSRESAEILFHSETGNKFHDKLLRLLSNGPMIKGDFNRHLSTNQKRNVANALEDLETNDFIRKTRIEHEGAGRPSDQWELIR